MTIIAILLAFALSHFIKDLAHIRRRGWLNSLVLWCNERLSMLPGWPGLTSFLVLLGLPLVLLVILIIVTNELSGQVGSFILSVLVLIYTLGPRSLDADVSAVVNADTDVERNQASNHLLDRAAPDDEDQFNAALTEGVFVQALRRWFAIIFWFILLGPVGALLYRMSDWLVAGEMHLSDGQRQSFWRLREVLEWPVAQLMTLGLAIAADFDSVFVAWKQYHNEQGHSLFEGNNGFLLAAARRVVLTGHAAHDGFADQLKGPTACVQQGMDLIWRVLGVWLTVLALMLLVGWIA